jgi:hypothetical protein
MGVLYQPRIKDEEDDDDGGGDCGTIDGMNDWQGNQSMRRKPASMLLWPPQFSYMTCPVSNPGRRGGKPALNRPNCGTLT